jgi:hypothetical protein
MSTSKPLPAIPTLFTQTLQDLWGAKLTFLKVLLSVALPTGLITLLVGEDSVVASYVSLATMFLNLALIWTVVEVKAGRPVTIKSAYYFGTAGIVRFLLTALIIALQLIPFTLGAAIYTNGVSGSTTSVTIPEKVLLGLVWLLLAWPSVYWVTRSIFSIYPIVEDLLPPVAALKASAARVKGRFFPVLGRLMVLLVVMVVVLAVPSFFLLGLEGVGRHWASFGLQLVSTVLFLPFSSLYLYNLYRALK